MTATVSEFEPGAVRLQTEHMCARCAGEGAAWASWASGTPEPLTAEYLLDRYGGERAVTYVRCRACWGQIAIVWDSAYCDCNDGCLVDECGACEPCSACGEPGCANDCERCGMCGETGCEGECDDPEPYDPYERSVRCTCEHCEAGVAYATALAGAPIA